MLPNSTQSDYSYQSFSTSKLDYGDRASVSSNLNLYISVELQLCDEEGNCETELIPYVKPVVTNDENIVLNTVVEQLKNKGYFLKNAVVSYYSAQSDAYIFCAIDPVPSYVTISLDDIVDQHLVLRVKLVGNEYKQEARALKAKKAIRIRLRKIGEVVEKVTQWRKMNAGYVDDNGMLIKMTLLEAAAILSIPKKSLDDYLSLLRLGKEYGFDFNLYKNHTVGTLRSFIKKHKVK